MKLNHNTILDHSQLVRNQQEFARKLQIYGVSFGLPQVTGINHNEIHKPAPAIPGDNSQVKNSDYPRTAKSVVKNFAHAALGSFKKLIESVEASRKQRQEIRNYLKLPDHYLHDIGLNRLDLEAGLFLPQTKIKLAVQPPIEHAGNSGFKESKITDTDCANDCWNKAA